MLHFASGSTCPLDLVAHTLTQTEFCGGFCCCFMLTAQFVVVLAIVFVVAVCAGFLCRDYLLVHHLHARVI